MVIETKTKEETPFLSNWNKKLISSLSCLRQLEIATLGPSGTSSEASAKYLLSSLKSEHGTYLLFPSYEEAYESLVSGQANILLVANAYKGIDKFYMSKDIQFLFPYVFETPLYGVAKRPSEELASGRPLVIATHHAPSSLLPWFLADFDMQYKIQFVDSTSKAAIKLQNREVDLCLTTANAAKKYHAEFISPTRTILMLWSVFGMNSTKVSLEH
ncbi:hypothetical protein H1Z61_13535 [Bacillus aquiflavi]|uniref:Bacilysin biosynthesis protein BacA n=1 Tax=Bacillus aquiflavi TaxID=2672567 RepID=A0A6B3VWL0_9BACI|nr:hypothetical protein [Bacillus aquiflavi]MBA4538129.1 hypothetical protein [Bacillus aquiflavi]NEY82449.1 hypothetical protein [Bacillus aquiflavi]UAC48579.1 hypothetical protein K6959_00815 [Bacillus aquiflavi]